MERNDTEERKVFLVFSEKARNETEGAVLVEVVDAQPERTCGEAFIKDCAHLSDFRRGRGAGPRVGAHNPGAQREVSEVSGDMNCSRLCTKRIHVFGP